MVVDAEGGSAAGELVDGPWSPVLLAGTPAALRRFKPAPALRLMAAWRSGGRLVSRDEQGLLYGVGREDGMIRTSGNESARPGQGRNRLRPDPRGGGARLRTSGWGGDRADPAHGRGEAREALRAFLKRSLPNFMQPGHIVWRDELPRSPNGKLDRVALKNELMA